MIKLIKSTFYHESLTKRKLVKFISSAKQLSFGPECEKFERNFSVWQGRSDAVFFNSGSSANYALLHAYKNMGILHDGDKVAFSAVTWSTNVMPIFQLGMIPVPVDVEINTLNISSKKLFDIIKANKIKAVFITNLLGFCDDIDEIKRLCKKKNILLIEDNCESLGTVYKNTKLGNFGNASTFSFYVGHHMSTIEGGAVCTDDKDLAQMLRLVRAHGWDRNLSDKDKSNFRRKYKIKDSFYGSYSFYDLGFNFRPTEINGFIGNIQLNFIDDIIKKRRDNFLFLAKSISGNNKYYPLKYDHIDLLSNFAFPLVCRSSGIRNELIDRCKDVLEIRPIVGGSIADQPFFKKYNSGSINECSNAKIIHNNGLYFGNNPELTMNEINKIIKILT